MRARENVLWRTQQLLLLLFVILMVGCGASYPQSYTFTAVQGSGQTRNVSTSFPNPLTVKVTNSSGAGVAGLAVNFSAPCTGATATLSSLTATTDASGQASVTAVAGSTAGSYVVSATVSGSSGVATFNLTNSAAAPAATSIVAGNNQAATVTTTFGTALGLLVMDSNSNPVSGVTVSFAVPGSGAGAVLTSSTAVTGSNGIASVIATANTHMGSYAVTAAVNGSYSQSFLLTNNAGVAVNVAVSGGTSQSAKVNTTFTNNLVASVTDAYGNVASGANVTFTPPVGAATAALWGTAIPGSSAKTAVSDTNGLASVTAIAGTATGSYSVVATVPGGGSSASFALTNAALTSDVIAQVYVDPTQTPVYPMPSNFVSLSLTQSEVQTLIGYQDSTTYPNGTITMNPIFEKLIDNLTKISGGPMMLRMLGDGDGPYTLRYSIPILNKLNVDEAGTTYFMGVDFWDYAGATHNLTTAQGEVQNIFGTESDGKGSYYLGLTPSSMVAVELNNEPDMYGANGITGYSYATYEPEAETFISTLLPYAMYANTTQQYFFTAPVFAGYVTSWNEAGFIADNAASLNMFNFHYYGGSNCDSSSGSVTGWQAANPGLSYLYSSGALAFGLNYPSNSYLSNALANARAKKLPYIRVGEMNSISCSGYFGASDNFTSAVWAMDMAMTYAAAGVNGVNFFLSSSQTYVGGAKSSSNNNSPAYNPFDFTYTTGGGTRTWTLAYVAPEYYGMMMLAYELQNSAGVIPLTMNTHAGNFSAWATKDTYGVTRVLLLNKENGSNNATIPYNGNVSLVLPGHGTASVIRLAETETTTTNGITYPTVNASWWNKNTSAPNAIPAVTGITINGQTFDGSTDGSLKLQPANETVSPVNGTYTVSVPVGNSVILTIP